MKQAKKKATEDPNAKVAACPAGENADDAADEGDEKCGGENEEEEGMELDDEIEEPCCVAIWVSL